MAKEMMNTKNRLNNMLIPAADLSRFSEAKPMTNFSYIKEDIVDANMLWDREIKLRSWYRYYNLSRIRQEVSKMTELLGRVPDIVGKRYKKCNFFVKQYIWCFSYKKVPDSIIILSLSSEGLDLKITTDLKDHVINVMDELIGLIIPQTYM